MFGGLKNNHYFCKRFAKHPISGFWAIETDKSVNKWNVRIDSMDDKERIEYIIRDKGLTNVEFSAITGIAPATISHITSGRSKPTLPILKGILRGFPDLNPEWVFMGEGPVYKQEVEQAADTDRAPLSGSYDLFSSLDEEGNAKPAGPSKVSRQAVASTQNIDAAGIKDVIRESFESVLGKQRRQIVEVRIFFDDGTYEAFSTPKTK